MNRIFKLTLLIAFLTVCMEAQAFQAVDSTTTQSQETKSYLSGKLLSWTDKVIKTTVGNYELNHEIVVIDQTGKGKKAYAKDEPKPSVQLIFENNRLIRVTIY